MKFVLVFGPQAVGKMTVGEELTIITPLRLYHNHMSIEPLLAVFGDRKETWQLSEAFRRQVFEVFAKSDLYGLIFTYVWAFDVPDDGNWVSQMCQIFEAQGATVYFVELESNLVERRQRNTSPHRLAMKPSKRNMAWSDRELIETTNRHRLNSNPGEITRDHYIRINNTHLEAHEVARIIRDHFNL